MLHPTPSRDGIWRADITLRHPLEPWQSAELLAAWAAHVNPDGTEDDDGEPLTLSRRRVRDAIAEILHTKGTGAADCWEDDVDDSGEILEWAKRQPVVTGVQTTYRVSASMLADILGGWAHETSDTARLPDLSYTRAVDIIRKRLRSAGMDGTVYWADDLDDDDTAVYVAWAEELVATYFDNFPPDEPR